MDQKFLAFDLGAESGRGILAHFDGNAISLGEGRRFSTAGSITAPDSDGVHRWDFKRISDEIDSILKHYESETKQGLSGVAVDTWGVDFGLIGEDNNLLENPVWYRDSSHITAMNQTLEHISKRELWQLTGIQLLPFNSIFQFAAIASRDSSLIRRASRMLFMPDLLVGKLIGSWPCCAELTVASTSQLLDPITQDWNTQLIGRTGIPRCLFQPLVLPGKLAGTTPGGTPVFFAAGHDTASAVAAVPVNSDSNWAYISSGTWSLVGVERDKPLLTEQAFELGLSNEIGAEGKTRLLKNVMGMWLIQECRRSFINEGKDFTYSELTAQAAQAGCNGPVIDAADQRFLAPVDMPAEIQQSCRDSGQDVPSTVGPIIRCALDSLALAYRRTLRDLEGALGSKFNSLHIVGGGSNNTFLNQLTADACGIPVVAGPSEATAAGNILSQLVASGEVADWSQARQVCLESFSPRTYLPNEDNVAQWNEREERFLRGTVVQI